MDIEAFLWAVAMIGGGLAVMVLLALIAGENPLKAARIFAVGWLVYCVYALIFAAVLVLLSYAIFALFGI